MAWNKYQKSVAGSDTAIKCESVDSFLGYLTNPPAKQVKNTRRVPPSFIFRGHSDYRYKLVPNAFRENKTGAPGNEFMWKLRSASEYDTRYKHSDYKPRNPAASAYRMAELLTVGEFYRQVDRAGLPLPYLSQSLHRELVTGNPGELSSAAMMSNASFNDRVVKKDWPVTELIPVLALAQHYELPTRLLDWTWSSLVAAYFAASSCVKGGVVERDPTRYLSVWATVVEQLQIPISDEQGHTANIPQNHEKIFRFQPTVHSNPNQKLQQGLFTFSLDRVSSGGRPEQESVTALTPQNELCAQDCPEFFQILLPASLAPELMHRLHSMGYMKARVMEGYTGVAASVRESVDLQSTIWGE